ncbi:hypothetical protein DOJK_01761 [Patescibacteria group bacterium]|nr:hypothetical protein DOJK_01761 [Patescibacteria group bacterium]
MDLLYRVGGLSGTEIGEMIGVDYSTVRQGRKRLREKLKDDKHISQIVKRVEADLSMINRLSENVATWFSLLSQKNESIRLRKRSSMI